MSRTQNLLFAALLLSSVTAFAADTPDPSKGEEVLPPGSFEGVPPSTPPPAAQLPPDATGQSGVNPDATPRYLPRRGEQGQTGRFAGRSRSAEGRRKQHERSRYLSRRGE